MWAGEPLAATAVSAASRKAIHTVRIMGSVRRIESIISVRRGRIDFECLMGFGFV